MNFYSRIFKVKVISSVFLIIWILILLLITINNTLSCIDMDGCLKSSCHFTEIKENDNNKTEIDLLRTSYQRLILKNCPKFKN